jgi:hypothetical protein
MKTNELELNVNGLAMVWQVANEAKTSLPI